VKYLLDTHTFLWFITADVALSVPAKTLIENANHTIYLSVASVWEMAIKVSLGKLTMPSPFTEFVLHQLNDNAVLLLNIEAEHAGRVATLPFYHRDPFDRLIIAQSLSESLPIIGKDEIFDSYGIQPHW
jgi:PIN domain nuclease of toxin-antitoxin system